MEEKKLKRVLKLSDLMAIAIGQIIGAGIVTLTGVAIGMTGPSVYLAYIFAGIIVLIASLLLAMTGSAIPSAGSFYTWTSRILSPFAGFMTLWLFFLNSVSLSLYGLSFGLYIHPFIPSLSTHVLGIIILTAFFIANIFGVRVASTLERIMVIIMITAFLVYAGFGLPHVKLSYLSPMFPKGFVGLLTATSLLLFATGGATVILELGGEMERPERDIPYTIIFSTLAVAVLYAIIAFVTVGTLSWTKLVNQPLTVAGKTFLPMWAFIYFLVGGAVLAIVTTLNSQFMWQTKSLFMSSRDRLLPTPLSSLNKYGVPWVLLVIIYLIGVIPLALRVPIDVVASAATTFALIDFILITIAAGRFPWVMPEKYEKALFKLPRKSVPIFVAFGLLTQIIGIILLGATLPSEAIYIAVIWAVIGVVYYFWRKQDLRRKGVNVDDIKRDYSVFER